MDRIAGAMMHCIQGEIFNRTLDAEEFADYSAEDWRQVYRLSKKHALAHIVGEYVINHQLLSDDALLGDFKKQTLLAVSLFRKQSYELSRIRGILIEHGIPFVVLKGPAIRELYPNEWLRNSCDIDVLVDPVNIEKAKEILCKNLAYEANPTIKHYHHISFYSPSGVHLELHYNLLEQQENVDALLKDAMNYTLPAADGSCELRFTTEFLIFYITAHLCHHLLNGGCGVRPFIDFKLLIDKAEYDSDILYDMLDKTHMRVFFENVTVIAGVWFGTDAYNDVCVRLEDYILRGGIYGTRKNRILADQAQSGKRQSLINRVFLPYSSLRVLYSEKNVTKWNAPYYQLLRWLDLLRFKKIGNGIAEIKMRTATDEEDIGSVERLMSDLGL